MFRKEVITNFVYSFGASIVILGALFKMTHWHVGFITGNVALAAGLITEAFIFLFFAFDAPPPESHYAWENVYPELIDGQESKGVKAKGGVKDLETTLSEKLDKMLQDAQLDVSLLERLRGGMDKLSTAIEHINQTGDISASTHKYNEQLNLAASHLESMNALYTLQLEHGEKQSEFSKKYVEDIQKSVAHSEKFNEELSGLTANLNNLNRVYGGMLTAMKS